MLRQRKKRNSNPSVQLTALVDAFTILVVFFIMQYSAEPEMINPKDRVKLPLAENAYATESNKNINVLISDRFIKINDNEMISLSAGRIANNTLHTEDTEFISGLHGKLEEDEVLKDSKDHQWIILADEKVPYETVKKTIYTLAVSGYTKIKLASTVEFK